MKHSDTFVLDKCEINVDKKLDSEPHVDLHKLRTSKSVRLCPPPPYKYKRVFPQTETMHIKMLRRIGELQASVNVLPWNLMYV